MSKPVACVSGKDLKNKQLFVVFLDEQLKPEKADAFITESNGCEGLFLFTYKAGDWDYILPVLRYRSEFISYKETDKDYNLKKMKEFKERNSKLFSPEELKQIEERFFNGIVIKGFI